MTGTQTRRHVVVSAVPRTFRVSIFGGRTQLDIELPADVPIANIVPDLAALISSRDIKREDAPDDSLENKRDRWVLTRVDSGAAIDPDQTLAEAGAHDGDLLKLTAERALTAPELFDDVVDAVARLNREGFAGWGPRTARAMAFAGVIVAVGVIDLILLRGDDLGVRTLLAYQTIGVIAALLIAAVVAQRFYGEEQVATTLGLAALPLVFGATTVFTEHLPDGWAPWSMTIVCATVAVAALAGLRVVRSGRIGYLSAALTFACFVVASAIQAGFHWPAHIIGPVLATCGVLLSLCAGPLARLVRSRSVFAAHTSDAPSDDHPQLFANPFEQAAPHEERRRAGERASARVPSADEVAASVARFRSIRTALYLSAASIGVTGAMIAAFGGATWSVIAFNLVVATAMMLRGVRRLAFTPAAVMLLAGVLVVVGTCVSLRSAPAAMYQTAGLLSLGIALVALAVGTAASPRPSTRVATALDHLEYLAVLAILPLLAWTVGLYELLGRR